MRFSQGVHAARTYGADDRAGSHGCGDLSTRGGPWTGPDRDALCMTERVVERSVSGAAAAGRTRSGVFASQRRRRELEHVEQPGRRRLAWPRRAASPSPARWRPPAAWPSPASVATAGSAAVAGSVATSGSVAVAGSVATAGSAGVVASVLTIAGIGLRRCVATAGVHRLPALHRVRGLHRLRGLHRVRRLRRPARRGRPARRAGLIRSGRPLGTRAASGRGSRHELASFAPSPVAARRPKDRPTPAACGRLAPMPDQQQRASSPRSCAPAGRRVTPEQVKLPRGRSRRTPGLRREEVALLAGVSVTWYTWLEQGRRINASTDVLRAIGRALRLDEAGQDHLVSLAQPLAANGAAPATPDEVPSALRRLIEAFEPAPAYVLGPHWEFAAWNAAEARLYPPLERLEGIERNLIWVLFAHDGVRQLIVDWDIHARQALAEFRAATTAVRHDPAMTELVDRLSDASAEFRAWWPEHDVARFETRLRRFDHPRAGLLTFEYQQLMPGRVAGAAHRRPAPRPRRRLRPPPRRPPRRVLNRSEPAGGSSSRRGGSAPRRPTTTAATAWAALDRGGEGVDVGEVVATAAAPPPPRREAGRERVAGADRVDDRHRVDGHGDGAGGGDDRRRRRRRSSRARRRAPPASSVAGRGRVARHPGAATRGPRRWP